MLNDVNLTIDGTSVKTKAGNNVLQAAMDAGLYIPYLCYYPGMKAFGACRMCVVQAEQPGPDGKYKPLPGSPASCTVPVAEGMRIQTQSAEIVGLRRGIMELLLSEHPHGCLTCHRVELCGPSDICLRHVSVNDRCVTCPKNERCELKDTVRHLEMDMDTPLTYNNRHLPQRTNDPFWEMDLNLCIVCGRCVRVCDEMRGDDALAFTDRAGRSLIGTSHGTSLLESGCEFCGACIDVCPTGALVERDYKWDKANRTVTSTCPHCPVGCQIDLEVDKRNRLIRTVGNRHAEANHGQLCFKGKFGLNFVNHQERLKKPLVRINGNLEEQSWLDALDVVAKQLSKHKGDEYALIASPRGTNEDNYIAQKFARTVMKTNNVNISSNTRPELTPALGEMLGYQASSNSLWELALAKCILVVSSNITEEQTVAAVPVKKAVKQGTKLIVIDQRETELTRFATMWLRPKPGTETTLIGGMLRVIIDESLDDHEFLAERSAGVQEFRNSLWHFDLIKVSAITALPESEIQSAARMFATNGPSAIMYALETLAPNLRDNCVKALVNLALVTGNIGKTSSGIYPLYSGANEQGSRDIGCIPDYLPGYKLPSDNIARQQFSKSWGVDLPSSAGLGLKELTEAILERRIKALHIIGDSPNFTNGELGNFLDALKKLDFLLVQDTFPNQLTDMADVILPSSTFAEKDGTYTNMERRVQLLKPALGTKGEEDADGRILSRIANQMNALGFDHENTSSVFDEISSLVEIYQGMSHKKLSDRSFQWPYFEEHMSDSPILYTDSTMSQVKLLEMSFEPITPTMNANYPYLLARGRLLYEAERTLEISKKSTHNAIERVEVIELHQEDALELGFSDGDQIELLSNQERFQGIVSIASPHKGLISTTSLFGKIVTELDLSTEHDPMLKIGGLPLISVRVEKPNADTFD